MLGGKGGQAVHAPAYLVFLAVKDDHQLPLVDPFVRVVRHVRAHDVREHKIGAAAGQGKPRQHPGYPGAVFSCGESLPAQGALDIARGKVDNALMVGHALRQHGLKGFVVFFPLFLDPGGDQGLFLLRDTRHREIVPFQVTQLFKPGGQAFHVGGHLHHNDLVGAALIEQLEIFIIALGKLGKVHAQNAFINTYRLPALGIILEDNGHNAALTALDGG